eukprot:PITA_02472
MHSKQAAISYFRKMFPLWHMETSEAKGLSGGLAVLWDPSWINAKAYKCFAGILITVVIRGYSSPINILNIYAPYKNRSHFWEKFFDSEIFDIDSLMIAGDLNITLCPEEQWGKCKNRDPLSDRIKYELLHRNLGYVVPTKMMPTWNNGRAEEAYIAKRIDRFIVHVSIIDKMGMPFSTIENAFISDHRPISLCWKEKEFRSGGKSMAKKKSQSDRLALQEIQKEMDDISKLLKANTLPFTLKCRLNELERKKQNILKEEEALWRLKSQVIWLKEGDRNTKFFHWYANSRRERNAIWKISDGQRGFLFSQQEISKEAVRHFKDQYKRRENNNFQDILWGIDLVPQMFDDEKNEELFQPITEEELLGVMKAFKKDKCLGSDG